MDSQVLFSTNSSLGSFEKTGRTLISKVVNELESSLSQPEGPNANNAGVINTVDPSAQAPNLLGELLIHYYKRVQVLEL